MSTSINVLQAALRRVQVHRQLTWGTTRSRQFTTSSSTKLHVLYDGSCPLCVKEITLLQKLKAKDKLDWIDISQPSFRCETYGKDVDIDKLMNEMHLWDPVSKTHFFGSLQAAVQGAGTGLALVMDSCMAIPAGCRRWLHGIRTKQTQTGGPHAIA